jgi:hypothetical protein
LIDNQAFKPLNFHPTLMFTGRVNDPRNTPE